MSSRVIIRPTDGARSRHFYGEVLGLAVFREFGDPADPGVVYFLGSGLLEISGQAKHRPSSHTVLWMQVRDAEAEYDRISRAGVAVLREPRTEPWGLIEGWIADPDGNEIVLVEIPAGHPLRRDTRGLSFAGEPHQ